MHININPMYIACMSLQLQRNLAHTISIYLSYISVHQWKALFTRSFTAPNGPQFYFLWSGHPALLQSFCHVKCPIFVRHWCLHFSCLHQILFNIPSRNKPSIPPCLPVFSQDWPLTSLMQLLGRLLGLLDWSGSKKWARGATTWWTCWSVCSSEMVSGKRLVTCKEPMIELSQQYWTRWDKKKFKLFPWDMHRTHRPRGRTGHLDELPSDQWGPHGKGGLDMPQIWDQMTQNDSND